MQMIMSLKLFEQIMREKLSSQPLPANFMHNMRDSGKKAMVIIELTLLKKKVKADAILIFSVLIGAKNLQVISN